MPYITQARRDALEAYSYTGGSPTTPSNAGELNYKITSLLVEYLNFHGKNYQHINDIVGALEGAKMEFYRRVAAPYEDTKIKDNGDVY